MRGTQSLPNGNTWAVALLKSIEPVSAVASRDLAIIGVLIYTAARAGATRRPPDGNASLFSLQVFCVAILNSLR